MFDPSSGNRYAYVNGNPVNLVDPTGSDTIWGACAKQFIIWGACAKQFIIWGAAGAVVGFVTGGPGRAVVDGLIGGLGGCAAGEVGYIGQQTGLWNFFGASNS